MSLPGDTSDCNLPSQLHSSKCQADLTDVVLLLTIRCLYWGVHLGSDVLGTSENLKMSSWPDVVLLLTTRCLYHGGTSIRSTGYIWKFEHTLHFMLCFTEVFSTKDQWGATWYFWSLRPLTPGWVSKQQKPATFNYHAITTHVSSTLCPSKVMYTNYFICRYETTMSVYIPHMNSMQSIMWPKALVFIHYTLLPYTSEQTCLPHCRYMSHCTSNVVYIWNQYYCTHPSKSIKCNIYLPYYCKICPSNKYALKYLTDAICQIYLMCINGGVCHYIFHIKPHWQPCDKEHWTQTLAMTPVVVTMQDDNDAMDQLHIQSGPLIQMSQKRHNTEGS